MIVQTTHFKGHLLIPNLEGSNPLGIGNNKELLLYIKKEEPRLLVKLFGYELAKEVSSSVDDSGSMVGGAEQKFVDLVQGKDDYVGLVPIISNYIFGLYIQDHDEELGGVGVIKEKSKGAERASIRTKYVRAMREYFELTIGTSSSPTMIVRGTSLGMIWAQSEYDTFKPLKKYMDENKADFENAIDRFYLIKNTNYYGI